VHWNILFQTSVRLAILISFSLFWKSLNFLCAGLNKYLQQSQMVAINSRHAPSMQRLHISPQRMGTGVDDYHSFWANPTAIGKPT
jgi:hypothetical protein